jgi:excisionase family DNA binding protein
MLKRNNTWEALPLVLDTFQVADIIHCHPETVKRALRSGKLKGNKVGGRNWSVSRDALREYIEGGTTA